MIRLRLYTLLLLLPLTAAPLFANSNPNDSRVIRPQAELSIALKKKLSQATLAQGKNYIPRTEHLDKQGKPVFTNRLILESSPYLLQHAHNPVNWYSWSSEALDEAKRTNKPIFLSIGYSTCHWCHVMEKESFENLEIANFLNQHFISIKVDREQRPDIDSTYMIAAAMLSGQTGWPLNTLNTSDGAPFYAATYFPPEHFLQLLQKTQQIWQEQQTELKAEGQRIIYAIKKIQENKLSPKNITASTYEAAIEQWLDIFDEFEGGFGTAPKFPQESALLFLLDQAKRKQDLALLEMVTKTLNAMQKGGIYDQIGGGFHRYATDPSWNIPHFEKMLYNQAQLAQVYLRAYLSTGDPLYKLTAEETLNYTLREMSNTNGLFYSATDADSEGEEGTFFLWTDETLKQDLDDKSYKLAKLFFGVEEGPNFSGKNILFQPLSVPDFVIQHQLNPSKFLTDLSNIKQKLRNVRQKRESPHLDDKVITAWNSMLIRVLTESGHHLNNPNYTAAAIKAADALWLSHYLSTGLLRDTRHIMEGSEGNLEDYATFAMANLTLFKFTSDTKWLNRALILSEELIEKFWEADSSTLFLTSAPSTGLVRMRSQTDQATPAAESTAYELFTNLANSQLNQKFGAVAHQLLVPKSGKIDRNPVNYSYLLMVHAKNDAALDSLQIGAHGALRAELKRVQGNFILTVTLKPGWHINAKNPGDKRLIGSRLSADWVNTITYPIAHKIDVSFAEQPINLYSGAVQFSLKSKKESNTGPLTQPLKFTYQACSDKQCLAPETLYFSPNMQ